MKKYISILIIALIALAPVFSFAQSVEEKSAANYSKILKQNQLKQQKLR